MVEAPEKVVNCVEAPETVVKFVMGIESSLLVLGRE